MDALLLKGERQSLPVSEVERKKKMNGLQKILDPTLQSPDVRDLETALRQRVVGQDRPIRRLARVFQVYKSGLSAPRPADSGKLETYVPEGRPGCAGRG